MKNLKSDFTQIRRDKLIPLIIFLSLIIFQSPVMGRIRIDIYGPELIPFPIAVAPFESGNNKDLATQAQTILVNDLKISGFFKVNDSEKIPLSCLNALKDKDSISLSFCKGNAYDAIVDGGLNLEGDKLNTFFRLFDLIEESFVTGLRYTAPLDDLRQLSHRMADEIIFHLTGQVGISNTQIAFVSNRGGTKEIFVTDFDGHRMWRLTNHNSICLSPAWSPNGKSIAYTCFRKRNPDVYLYDIHRSDYKIISSRAGVNGAPAWSPDGRRMAVMMRRGDSTKIAIIDVLKDYKPLFLTAGPGNEASPTWSPDGQNLAFLSDRSGSPQIYTIGINGENLTRITFQGAYNASPAWSPIGDRIAFCSMLDGHFDIITCNPDGNDVKRVTQNTGNNEAPVWSPDGRYIAFSSNRTGKNQIFCINANGANPRQITSSEFDCSEPTWSPYKL